MPRTTVRLAATLLAISLACLPTLASAVGGIDYDAPVSARPMTPQQRARAERDRRARERDIQQRREEAMRRELLRRQLRHARRWDW